MVYIHRKVACATFVLDVKFLPGMNTISDAEMAKIENHPGFTSEIACGNMYIGGRHESETTNAVEATNETERGAKLAQEIQSMDIQKAKELISKTGDVYMLHAIKKLDCRKGIQEAVDARISSIKGQDGADLTPTSIPAPEGNGSDFADKLTGSKLDVEGTKVRTAIPALKGK